MFSSVPVSLLSLGLRFEEYEHIAGNIRRMQLISDAGRKRILERGEVELSPEEFSKVLRLRDDMADDRGVYKIAELKYWKGPPRGKNLFVTAVLDYLLCARYFMN